MQPFQLPEFYMPYPARLNPNLEGARVHSKAWAYEMGILGSEQDAEQDAIWDERKFDAMDYSYTHPDVPGPVMFVFISMLIANTSLSSAFWVSTPTAMIWGANES